MNTVEDTKRISMAGEEIDFSELLITLRRHWKRIAYCTTGATLLAGLLIMVSTPKFSIEGSLYLGDAGTSAPVSQNAPSLSYLTDFQTVSDINTQIDLLKAKGMVEQAILDSGLNAPVTSAGVDKLPYWKWMLKYGHNMKAYAPGPGDLQATDATFDGALNGPVTFQITMGQDAAYTVTYKPSWFATPVMVLRGQLGQPASGNGLSMMLKPAIDGAPPPAGSRFVMRLSSAEAIQDALQTKNDLTVTAGGMIANPTKLANIDLYWENPYAGKEFVNALMKKFVATQVSWNSQAASTTQVFISNQLDGIKASLSTADHNLADYQAETGIIDVPENAASVISQLADYEKQRTNLQLQKEVLQQLKAEIANPSGALDPYLISQTGDSVLGQLATSLAAQEVNLSALRSRFTSTAPDVAQEEVSIAKQRQTVNSVVGNELASTDAALKKLNLLIDKFNAQLKQMPAQSLKVIALTRASDVYGQLYVLLMQKEEEAEVAKAAAFIGTRIVTPAEVPLKQTSPKVGITLAMGILLGLFGAVAVTIGQRALSKRFQSEEEIRRLVPLPVYGVIPTDSELQFQSTGLLTDSQSSFAEAMRTLRGNILRAGPPQLMRVVMISSSGTNDGKSTVALNLAKMMADSGKSVVLVDADLHVGVLHETLKTDASPGLSESLVSLERPNLQAVPGQRFMMLATGIKPPNPSELLCERYLANIFTFLRAEFEYIIIDSPPLPAVVDALTLQEYVDLVLTVVKIDHTSRPSFAIHNEMLSAQDKRLGLIINGVDGSTYGYGYASRQEVKPASQIKALLRDSEKV